MAYLGFAEGLLIVVSCFFMFTVALHSADSWWVWCLFDFVLSFV